MAPCRPACSGSGRQRSDKTAREKGHRCQGGRQQRHLHHSTNPHCGCKRSRSDCGLRPIVGQSGWRGRYACFGGSVNVMKTKLLVIGGCASAMAVLYSLWSSNFCFTEFRYLSETELCEKAKQSVPEEWLKSSTKCFIESGTFSAYEVDLGNLTSKGPKEPFGERRRLLDSCGRWQPFPH